MNPAVLEADLTWTGDRFGPGVQIAVGADGCIEAVGNLGRSPDLRLKNRALVPGMVSAHSHAFQRGLRGRGETFPASSGSFWSWREAMYGLVGRLDAEEFRALCLHTFREMRAAGITAVGEFHYFHHRETGPDAADYAFDELALAAAAEAGIRIALIEVYYSTGAVGQPLEGPQRRFGSPSPEIYWRQMDRLAEHLDPRRQSLAASVHSLRAAGPEDLAAVYEEARRRDLPFHIHVEEQRREIDDVLAYYGQRPMALLLETLGTATDLTAVHCTHTDAEEMDRFLAAGGTVCLCPLTEANLGDGIAAVPRAHPTSGSFCLGSDSNARISLIEEMRWLEYTQRLATEGRGLLRDPEGNVARTLWQAATTGGAKALGIEAGRIEPGLWADLAAIDLAAPSLAGWTPETLLESVIFGATEEVIAATCVGGEWVEHRLT
ncbi:MAG TPA: formimidoylglutamate deiminase [Thermoanaerobaculia bacterium]|jgi:formiminoglutamate deiminase|nr:formimidoylglutamate deiminase [Thermoanaerobaculia bacterium]